MIPLFYDILKKLFKNPCLILMKGNWRTGKTDTSLLIAYLGLKWGLIDKVASNIWTYNDKRVAYVTSLGRLNFWLHADRLKKLFIFDEALSHLSRRTSMSHKNVGILRIVPELSKGHGRIIFCAQTDKVDSALLDSAFLRAVFTKKRKKVMECRSKLFEDTTLTHLPRSPIRFDKDRLAPFIEDEGLLLDDLSTEVKCALLYARKHNPLSITAIEKELGIHRQTVKRNIRKVLRAVLKEGQTREVVT